MIVLIRIHGLAVAQGGIVRGFLTKKLGKHIIWDVTSCHCFKEYYISHHIFLLFFAGSANLKCINPTKSRSTANHHNAVMHNFLALPHAFKLALIPMLDFHFQESWEM
jgi:hypothetical protein